MGTFEPLPRGSGVDCLIFAALLLAPWQSCSADGGYTYRPLGNVSLPNPSFVLVLPCGTESPALWVTSFSGNPFSPGEVYTVKSISSYNNFSTVKPVLVSSDFKWPNIVSVAPKEIGDYLVVPDGFLVPLKSTGGIYLLEADCSGTFLDTKPIEITAPKSGWFYHKVEWRDINGDGRLDAITARGTKPIFGKSGGELLWLEQPPTNPLTAVPWKEHVLTTGPDIGFATVDFQQGDDQFELFATEFFAQRLSVLTISTKNATVTASRDIDTKLGPPFYVSVVDLNMDGTEDLLVTNHVGGSGGEVFAYEIPKDTLNGDYTKHVIASNFSVTEKGNNQASPGFAYAFKPETSYQGRPYILVAGDGAQKAYLLTPTDKDFVYNTSVVLSVNGVVGSIGIGDIIGSDGWAEFFVPDYDENRLYAFTFAP